jgi:methionyl-tRNA formyltransferase
MNIIFLSSGAFGLPTLKLLLASQHRILAVISQPDRPAGRGRHFTPTPVAQFAHTHGLPLTTTANVNAPEVLAPMAALAPDVLVVIAFGQKLSENLLAIAPHGGINLHASLLPEFRGAAPINRAILAGLTHTGVSVIRVTQRMDAGDILALGPTPIGDTETAGELHDRLADLGAPLLVRVLNQLDRGQPLYATPQDDSRASTAPKLTRAMGWVDFTQSATAVSARIRGLSPWPGCAVNVFTADAKLRTGAILHQCRANAQAPLPPAAIPGTVLPDLTIACGTGTLSILTLQPAGRKVMDLPAFINGYGLAQGYRLESAPPAG